MTIGQQGLPLVPVAAFREQKRTQGSAASDAILPVVARVPLRKDVLYSGHVYLQ